MNVARNFPQSRRILKTNVERFAPPSPSICLQGFWTCMNPEIGLVQARTRMDFGASTIGCARGSKLSADATVILERTL
jgi:hypothetical protein